MLEDLGLVAAAVCILAGGFLVYYATTGSDPTQIAWLFSGAVVLSAGLVGAVLITKSKLEWSRHVKRHRQPY